MGYMSGNKRILTLLVLLAMLLPGCQSKSRELMEEPEKLVVPQQANYKTVQVERGTYAETVTIKKIELVYLKKWQPTWKEEGTYLVEIKANKGQEFSKGDVLMQFDVNDHKAELEELRLQLSRKQQEITDEKVEREAAIAEAEQNLQGLTGHQRTVAELRLEKLQTSCEQYLYQAEREIQELRQKISKIQERVDNDTLIAPFDGVCQDIFPLEEGQEVYTSTTLCWLYATDAPYYLLLSGNTENLGYNMRVTVSMSSGETEERYTGTIVSTPTVQPLYAGIPGVLVLLDDAPDSRKLQKGIKQYTCTVAIHEMPDVLLVDSRAVYSEEDRQYVYVLDGDMLCKRYVEVGGRDPELTWIASGVSEGQTLVLK